MKELENTRSKTKVPTFPCDSCTKKSQKIPYIEKTIPLVLTFYFSIKERPHPVSYMFCRVEFVAYSKLKAKNPEIINIASAYVHNQ